MRTEQQRLDISNAIYGDYCNLYLRAGRVNGRNSGGVDNKTHLNKMKTVEREISSTAGMALVTFLRAEYKPYTALMV